MVDVWGLLLNSKTISVVDSNPFLKIPIKTHILNYLIPLKICVSARPKIDHPLETPLLIHFDSQTEDKIDDHYFLFNGEKKQRGCFMIESRYKTSHNFLVGQ